MNIYYVAAIWLGMALIASLVSIKLPVPAATTAITIDLVKRGCISHTSCPFLGAGGVPEGIRSIRKAALVFSLTHCVRNATQPARSYAWKRPGNSEACQRTCCVVGDDYR